MPLIIIEFEVGNTEHALQVMESNTDTLERVTQQARAQGALHHQFYADPAGQIMVAVDDWSSEADFRKFFTENAEIADIMAQVGVRREPKITVLEPMKAPGTF